MRGSQTQKILGGVPPSISVTAKSQKIDGGTPPKIFSLRDAGFTNTKNLRWRPPIDFCDREVTEKDAETPPKIFLICELRIWRRRVRKNVFAIFHRRGQNIFRGKIFFAARCEMNSEIKLYQRNLTVK